MCVCVIIPFTNGEMSVEAVCIFEDILFVYVRESMCVCVFVYVCIFGVRVCVCLSVSVCGW